MFPFLVCHRNSRWHMKNKQNPSPKIVQSMKRNSFEQVKVDLRTEHKQNWITVVLMECDKGVNNLKWHVGSDLSDIPEMKEAWLNQFSNMLIEMQRRVETHPKFLGYWRYTDR